MDILLDKIIILTPENEKTNIILPFMVKENTEKLIIDYSYSPKEMGDCERAKMLIEENLEKDAYGERELYPDYTAYLPLKNLITISLDSPTEYMGAAHRHDQVQHHIISKDFSSRGFIKGETVPGEWILQLNVHAVVTEECECRIKIQGGAHDE